MMNKKISIRLRSKVFIFISGLFLILLLVQSAFVKQLLGGILYEKVFRVSEQSSENLALAISNSMQSQFNMTLSYTQNPEIISSMTRENHSQTKIFNTLKKNIINENPLRFTQYPFHYLVITKEEDMYSNFSYKPMGGYNQLLEEFKGKKWFDLLLNEYSRQARIFSDDHLIIEKGGRQLYFAQNVISKGKNIGIILTGIDSLYLSKLLRQINIESTASIFIVNQNGDILIEAQDNKYNFIDISNLSKNSFSALGFIKSKDNDTTEVKIEDKGYTISKHLMVINGYEEEIWLISLVETAQLSKEIMWLGRLSFGIALACLVSAAVIVKLFNKIIIRPIEELNRGMELVKEGDLSVRVLFDSSDEIGELTVGFNNMVSRLNAYVINIEEQEKLKYKQEIDLLQSQMKPHFVRNILNNIRWMGELVGSEGISRSMLALSNMLDYNFNDSNITTNVRDELNYLNEYIYLQQVRYQYKFRYEQVIDDNMMDMKILKLVFQPLVENSIHHGILPKKGLCTIVLSGIIKDGKLIFTICDDGIGIEEERIPNLLNPVDDNPNYEKTDNMALWNIDQRIKKRYGNEYGLHIERNQNNGTTVEVLLPSNDHS